MFQKILGWELSGEEIQAKGIRDLYLRASLVSTGVADCHIMGHVARGEVDFDKMTEAEAKWGLAAGNHSANFSTVVCEWRGPPPGWRSS